MIDRLDSRLRVKYPFPLRGVATLREPAPLDWNS